MHALCQRLCAQTPSHRCPLKACIERGHRHVSMYSTRNRQHSSHSMRYARASVRHTSAHATLARSISAHEKQRLLALLCLQQSRVRVCCHAHTCPRGVCVCMSTHLRWLCACLCLVTEAPCHRPCWERLKWRPGCRCVRPPMCSLMCRTRTSARQSRQGHQHYLPGLPGPPGPVTCQTQNAVVHITHMTQAQEDVSQRGLSCNPFCGG